MSKEAAEAVAATLASETPQWSSVFAWHGQDAVRLLQDKSQLVIAKCQVTDENVAVLLGAFALADAVSFVCNVEFDAEGETEGWENVLNDGLSFQLEKRIPTLPYQQQLELFHLVAITKYERPYAKQDALFVMARTIEWPTDIRAIFEAWLVPDYVDDNQVDSFLAFAALARLAGYRPPDREGT